MLFRSFITALAATLSLASAIVLPPSISDKTILTSIASIVAPTGYKSSIFIWHHGNRSTGVESQIEFSFMVQANTGVDFALVATDVSYVAGFTYPVVCSCEATGARLSGCDVNLWVGGACPMSTFTADGACENPYRDNTTTSVAHPWFAPCAGRAWTFPNDTAALSNGVCQTARIGCVVLPNPGAQSGGDIRGGVHEGKV
ncbi:hypothetical protein QBC34DRAFT_441229 [Podospora aff. communis PSN243]|uniref:Uncharacterized protein n=1 Tax=Podospora aff. communis PSN243 TaxID=3040156 RepID=A0AAV9GEL2_9PEZI|nr:hypothetical protein QBC34DRAFT_441229 [Podospora aff. communis PSN243]